MKQYIMKFLLGFSLLSLTTVAAQAVEFKGVVGLGFDFGGDVLLSGNYTDGSSWEVRANQGLIFNGGMVMVTGSFETQATVGYKFGGPTAKNGSVTFDVMPIELMEFYRAGNVRMGLGISYHSSPKLKVDIPGSSLNGEHKYDDVLGTVVQIGYAPAGGIYSVDFRYTAVKFKQKNISNAQDINGNVAGVYASLYF